MDSLHELFGLYQVSIDLIGIIKVQRVCKFVQLVDHAYALPILNDNT